MKKVVRLNSERGGSDHEWLKSNFSFSFANWYEPTRMGFGALRVLNDDLITPGGTFEMHPHKDFEIITIPLSGAVTHEDNMGNKGTVKAGEVQAMSAGTGVVHSEYNASETEPLSLFQIWIAPNVKAAKPRYAQARFDSEGRKNAWQVLVGEDGDSEGLAIYQSARISRTDLDAGTSLDYSVAHLGNGVYIMVIEGEIQVEGETLSHRDAVELSEVDRVSILATRDSSVLLIEVPLH